MQSPAIILPAQEQEPPKDWIEEEFGRADFGDRRLTARLLKMTGQFFEHPRSTKPSRSLGDWGDILDESATETLAVKSCGEA